MKNISVIMPVCNGVESLRRAAASVLAQPELLELLICDDASTDGSAEILRTLAAEDGRVRPFFQSENQGVSAARNVCLRQARGAYIGFCDADDEMLPGCLAALQKALDAAGADMAACGFDRTYARTGRKDYLPLSPGPAKTDEYGAWKEMLRPDGYTTALWNKLFRREAVFTGDAPCLFDEEIYIVEDGEWISRLSIKTAAFIPERYYAYQASSSGAMYGRALTPRRMTELTARRKIAEHLNNAPPALRDLSRMKYQKGLRDMLIHALAAGDAADVLPLVPELDTWQRELYGSPALSRKEKLKYHLYRPIIRRGDTRLAAFLMRYVSGH